MARLKKDEDPVNFLNYTNTCDECGRPTSEQKPYCLEHVTKMPYVQELLAAIAVREAEMQKLMRSAHCPVNLDGSRATEILDLVRERGAMTMGKLSNEVLMPVDVIKVYAKRLEQAGLVRVTTIAGKNHRHLVVVARKVRGR